MDQGPSRRQGQRKGDFLAGKYLLEDCLGIGGMGEVYRATNVSLGRQVAVKVLSSEYVHIEEDVLRFLREARAAAGIRHSNVVDVFDVARDDDGTPFIVQELLAGEDLERYLTTRNGRLSYEEALEIMIPVADAVAAAHAQKVVHRDLKPANIFLARDRNKIVPKVLDFGACLFPTIAERSAKEMRMLIGTPHYMAPEQITSKQDVDARSDVWALGVIFWEMIVGETPFEAETTKDVLELVKTRDVPPLSVRSKGAPRELELLVAKCTKRNPAERYADAGAVHDAMLEVRRKMKGGPAVSRMDTLSELPAQRAPLGGAATDGSKRNESPLRAPAARPATPPAVASKGAPRKAPPLDRGEPSSLLDELDEPPRGSFSRQGSSKMTLSSPGSEPPAAGDDRDSLFASTPGTEVPKKDGQGAEVASPRRAGGPSAEPLGFDEGSIPPLLRRAPAKAAAAPVVERMERASERDPAIELAARPSSWPPAVGASSDASPTSSSMPPILDPRAFKKTATPLPAALLPSEWSLADAPSPPRAPPPVAHPAPASVTARAPLATADAPVRPRAIATPRRAVSPAASVPPEGWSNAETLKFAAVVALPAVVAFALVLAVPVLGAPVGRALRGDSTLGSAVLAVASLIAAAALSARSMLGERSRWLFVAAGGSVLFGMVMIIVTFAASEAAELGMPSSMGGLSTAVAPIAPLVLGMAALSKARASWVDPYARTEAVRSAVFASLMLFLMLALSPVGVVRTAAPPLHSQVR